MRALKYLFRHRFSWVDVLIIGALVQLNLSFWGIILAALVLAIPIFMIENRLGVNQ